ncbi:MAG TPA: ADP compounds hydrolase NudE [Gammaproteobacteria bacterium]|nr:ADP compounds hydrolase NudE [Gammaproteobacteria bacterium]
MDRQKPRILSRATLARTRLFHIEEIGLAFANGTEVRYERLQASRGAVLVVPLLEGDTVLLIREYAAGTHRYELALPKGMVEPEEDPLAAANRELMEETGYGARRLQQLNALSLAPGYFEHMTQIILARDLYPRRLAGDEPEEVEVVPWRLSALSQLVAREDCSEARSIAALYLARDLLQQEGASA